MRGTNPVKVGGTAPVVMRTGFDENTSTSKTRYRTLL